MKIPKEQLEKIILWGVVCIIVMVVLTTLVFSPNLKRSSQLRINTREERKKVLKAEQEVVELPKIKLNLKRLKGEIKQYEQNMPLATPDWLLGKLNHLAGETEIDFDKIEPKGYIAKTGSYLLQALHIGLRTDYHRLGMFINKLENTSSFVSVLDLSITVNKEDINKHIVKLTVGAYVEEK